MEKAVLESVFSCSALSSDMIEFELQLSCCCADQACRRSIMLVNKMRQATDTAQAYFDTHSNVILL